MDIVRISTKSNKMSKRTKQLKNTINEINTHAHTHTMEYNSAIKRNEILPFAATWMDLENIILSNPDREGQIRGHI